MRVTAGSSTSSTGHGMCQCRPGGGPVFVSAKTAARCPVRRAAPGRKRRWRTTAPMTTATRIISAAETRNAAAARQQPANESLRPGADQPVGIGYRAVWPERGRLRRPVRRLDRRDPPPGPPPLHPMGHSAVWPSSSPPPSLATPRHPPEGSATLIAARVTQSWGPWARYCSMTSCCSVSPAAAGPLACAGRHTPYLVQDTSDRSCFRSTWQRFSTRNDGDTVHGRVARGAALEIKDPASGKGHRFRRAGRRDRRRCDADLVQVTLLTDRGPCRGDGTGAARGRGIAVSPAWRGKCHRRADSA